MLRKVLFILVLSAPLLSFGKRSDMDAYASPLTEAQLSNKRVRRELSEFQIGKILGLGESFGHIEDQNANYRLTALYWVQSLRDKNGEAKLAELKENHTTTVPLALNNIIEKVVNQGWGKALSITDEEIKEWREKNPKTASHYVYNNGTEKSFVDTDDRNYYTALKIYETAQKDLKKIEANFQAHTTDEEILQGQNDKLTMLLNDYVMSEDKLRHVSGMQDYVRSLNGGTDRRPASIGEQHEKQTVFNSQ